MLEFSRGSSGELRLEKHEKSFDVIDGIDFVLQTLVVDDRSWEYQLLILSNVHTGPFYTISSCISGMEKYLIYNELN